MIVFSQFYNFQFCIFLFLMAIVYLYKQLIVFDILARGIFVALGEIIDGELFVLG